MESDSPTPTRPESSASINYAASPAAIGVEAITRHDVALVAFRLIALLTAYNGLLSLFQLSVALLNRDVSSYRDLLAPAILLFIYGGVASGLWMGAGRLSDFLLRGTHSVPASQEEVQSNAELARHLLAAGIALAGIYLLVFDAIPLLIWNGAAAFFQFRDAGTLTRTAGLQVLDAIVKFVIGIFLVLRAARIARRWAQYSTNPPTGDGPL